GRARGGPIPVWITSRSALVRLHPKTLRDCGPTGWSARCRYCCKSLFAQVTKNSPGRRRDFRVKMWGTSSPDGKLACDLGNVVEATRNRDAPRLRRTRRQRPRRCTAEHGDELASLQLIELHSLPANYRTDHTELAAVSQVGIA